MGSGVLSVRICGGCGAELEDGISCLADDATEWGMRHSGRCWNGHSPDEEERERRVQDLLRASRRRSKNRSAADPQLRMEA